MKNWWAENPASADLIFFASIGDDEFVGYLRAAAPLPSSDHPATAPNEPFPLYFESRRIMSNSAPAAPNFRSGAALELPTVIDERAFGQLAR